MCSINLEKIILKNILNISQRNNLQFDIIFKMMNITVIQIKI